MKKIVNSSSAPAPIGPYSQAVIIKDTLYVSGQVALDNTTGELVNSNIEAETKQVMTNLSHILSEAGYGFEDIVKCSIFIKNMNDFKAINAVYGEYFKTNSPARETIEVSRLPKDAHVEISCIAVKQ